MTTPSASFDQSLTRIERQLEQAEQALGQGDPARLEAAGGELQRATLELNELFEGRRGVLAPPEARQRLQRIAARMAAAREGLIRQAAHVERSLGVLLPQAKNPATYAKPAVARRYSM